MLLAIDLGNTNIKYGVFNGEELVASFRVSSRISRTADEYGSVLVGLLSDRGINKSDIDGIIFSSVIPALNYTIEHMCKYYTGKKPIIVNKDLKMNIDIKYLVPEELGADRIVNSVAAYEIYGGPCIVVDFGSATTFNLISDKGEFLGGAIAPGIKSSSESLTNTAAKLPRIELIKPKTIIGKTTIQNMQAGVIYGFSGLVEAIVKGMAQESGYEKVTVIATGGMSELVAQNIFDKIDRSLSLKGLKILYELNN